MASAFTAFIALAFLSWASDFVTLQGERTIYTVQCADGTWRGQTCTGRLVPDGRVRFRALRAHREVVFWSAGVRETSGRLTGCEIEDGRNWRCAAAADAAGTITLAMTRGCAVHETAADILDFHAVAKWRWFLLRTRLPIGHIADR